MKNKIENDETLDGGKVEELSLKDIKIDLIKKQKLTTARTLAYMLILILAFSVFSHILLTVWLLPNDKTNVVEAVDRIFHSWLPVISGFAGAAVSYFFTREK